MDDSEYICNLPRYAFDVNSFLETKFLILKFSYCVILKCLRLFKCVLSFQ